MYAKFQASITNKCCLQKIIEKLIRKKWVDLLEKYNMLTDGQFGFRNGKSCITNQLSYDDRVTETIQERKGWVDSIYLDFKKAFDRVPHERLLWKLEYKGGVQGNILKWMKDFLKGRKMRTVLRGKHSSWKELTSGVPQGSVLAPIMFLVYINDINDNIGNESYMNMFADDAKIQKNHKGKFMFEVSTRAPQQYEWSQHCQICFETRKTCHQHRRVACCQRRAGGGTRRVGQCDELTRCRPRRVTGLVHGRHFHVVLRGVDQTNQQLRRHPHIELRRNIGRFNLHRLIDDQSHFPGGSRAD